MSEIHRRNVLIGLLCNLGLAGCVKGVPWGRTPWISTTVRLAWHWIPGMRMRYRTTVSHRDSHIERVHVEEWVYVVRTVDTDRTARLEGRRTLSQIIEDKSLPASGKNRHRRGLGEKSSGGDLVELLMGANGVCEACSVQSFAASLPHQMLALRFPTHPVTVYDEWPEVDLPQRFSALLPVSLEKTTEGSNRLLEVHEIDGDTRAMLRTYGSIRTQAHGPSIVLQGISTWDLDRGRLLNRELKGQFLPNMSGESDNPGELVVKVERI